MGNGLTVVGEGSGSSGDEGSGEAGPRPSPIMGDVVCIAGAMLYALYTVAIRKMAPPDLTIFFGFLGLTTFVLFSPVVLSLALSGVEPLEALSWFIFSLILVKGVFDNVLSEYLWVIAVLYTSPSVATVGLSLTVPLAILSDVLLPAEWLVDPRVPTASSVMAAVAVVAGFLTINVASANEQEGTRGRRGGGIPEWCSGWSMRDPLLGLARRTDSSTQHGPADAHT